VPFCLSGGRLKQAHSYNDRIIALAPNLAFHTMFELPRNGFGLFYEVGCEDGRHIVGFRGHVERLL
jgi:hypothetical protein